MPCKPQFGPKDGIQDQVWLGQATSGSRRKETERCGNTSRGKLPGPRSSAEARGPPILFHTGASRVRHHISTGHAVHLFPTNTHNRAILNKHHVPSKLRTGDVLIVTRLRRLPNAGPDSPSNVRMPCKPQFGPKDGIQDQVWLGQATSGSRRKETERCGNTSRGKLPGPRSSAEGRLQLPSQFIDMQTLGKSFALFTFQKHVARRFFFTSVHFEFATSVCPDLMFLASRPAQEIERFSTSITNRPHRRPRRFPNAGPESFECITGSQGVSTLAVRSRLHYQTGNTPLPGSHWKACVTPHCDYDIGIDLYSNITEMKKNHHCKNFYDVKDAITKHVYKSSCFCNEAFW
uniref:Uncharacterized protein n=1 Tax=Caenorhabditis japonica TaxID=281687 RepID=A0A8R1EAJ1_CAEJA